MSNTSVKEQVKSGESVEAAPKQSRPPKPLLIEPKHVTIDSAGQAWRTVLVRLPEKMTADHLRDPKVFKLTQQSRQSALLKLDHILFLTFDEGQAIRATVTHATDTEVHLMIEQAKTFREQGQQFYSDGTLEVFWDGGAYSYRRMSDKIRLDNVGYLTEAQAVDALRKSYPKVV